MHINKLKVSHFRKFHSLELGFKRGLNIVIGDNEAGKSTVSHAIVEGLYANPSTKSKEFFERVYPWSGAKEVVIQLEFRAGESTFLLQKDFAKNELMLLNIKNQASITTYKESLIAIEKITNIPSRNVYESTAFVGQSDIARIDSSGDFIAAIQKTAGSGQKDVNLQTIIKKLKKEASDLYRGVDRPAKNPGLVQTTREKIKRLLVDLKERSQQWEKVSAASENQDSSKSKLQKVVTQIEELELLLKNHKLKKQSEKKLIELNNQISKYEERLNLTEKTREKIKHIDEELNQLKIFDNSYIDEDVKKINELTQRVVVLKQEQKQYQSQVDANKSPSEPSTNGPKISLIASISILLVGSLIAGLVAFLGVAPIVYISIFILTIAGAAGIYFFFQKTEEKKQNIKIEKQAEVDSISKRISDDIVKTRAGKRSILNKYGVESIDDFFAKKAQASLLYTSVAEQKARMEGLLNGESYETLRYKQTELLTQKKDIEVNSLTEIVRNSGLTSQEYLKKTRELDNLYLEKRKLEEKTTASKVRVEDSTVSYEDIVLLEEELENSKEALEQLERRYEVINLAIEGLGEAIKDTAVSANSSVSKSIEQYLPTLTKGGYTDARLTENLEIEVFSRVKNEWIQPTGILSKGTVDQIYFLTRMAFIELLVKDRSVPIILDDPFVTFDKARKEEVKDILIDIAEDHQVILFTHDPAYASWGNTVYLK